MSYFKTIPINKVRLPECHTQKGLVVVIDVIRAFTTTAYAFAAGAKEIIAVGEIDEAERLHRLIPNSLLAGEQQGDLIPGFHFGNSPVEMSKAEIKGKTLILRTSSGTQGVVKSINADRMLVSSFVIAEATVKRIKCLKPEKLSFIVTGQKRGGHEDLALADYLESKLITENVDPAPFLERVRLSPSGELFSCGLYPQFQKYDLEASCELDKFPFAIEVFREKGLHILRPVVNQETTERVLAF